MIELIKANKSFFDIFYNIKVEKTNIYWSGHKKEPDYNQLKNWYYNELNNKRRIIYQIIYNSIPIGYLYRDTIENNFFELSYAVSEQFSGRGIATKAISEVMKLRYGDKFKVFIAEHNEASKKVISNLGFTKSTFSYIIDFQGNNQKMEEYMYIKNTFIIAEAGVNHNGNIVLAKDLIDVAVEAGVDAVKFQTWKTELLVTQDAKQATYQTDNTGVEESQNDMLKKLELSYDDFKELKDYCDKKEILFLSTPDESESADFLNELQDIFKIGSGELTNIPFLKHIGAFKKSIILSTGMGTLGEIEKALSALIMAGTEKENITLLHATTMYPTPMKEVNLKAMLTLRDAFKVKVGYSDHTMGIEVPIAAVTMGAVVIEKHFTLSHEMVGPDHKASLEPQELKAMVKAIRNIEKAIGGTGEKVPQISEMKNKKVVQKSIVAKRAIKKGELFTIENLNTKRVGTGISSSLWEEVLGLKANNSFKIDEAIRL